MDRGNQAQRNAMRRRLRAIGAPCAICGKPIDYSLGWVEVRMPDGSTKRKRHPDSFEYDHRVSLKMGGDNSFANAQAVHRRCNLAKGSGQRRRFDRDPDADALTHSREW